MFSGEKINITEVTIIFKDCYSPITHLSGVLLSIISHLIGDLIIGQY